METILNKQNLDLDLDLDQNIQQEQIKILYQLLLPMLATSMVISCALVYALWDAVPHTALITWLSMMLGLLALRSIPYFIFRQYTQPKHIRRHAQYFVISNFAAGFTWGIGSIMLFPEQQLEYQLVILVVLVGIAAGTVSSLTTYLPAFLAYFPISMIPICIRFFLVDDSTHLSLGIMIIAFIIAVSFIGIKLSHTLKDSLALRFENIDLVKQLREQKNEAEHANIAKSKFLAAASHDLRQPLYALTLFTSVLDESIKYPKVRKVVDQIKSSVAALQNLFNALLDISQLDAGVTKVEKTDFNLAPIFKKLANDFDTQASQKGLKMTWPDCPYAVQSDPMLFEQILRNYISNAIRYTDQGEVRISCEHDGELLNIHVIDTGIGIPEDKQKNIFSEFYQLSNPERDRSKGLGLGLAIVQRTAKLLGHSISISSKPNIGSIFSISVKQAKLAEELSTINTEAEEIIHQDNTFIVVIDDEASVREGTKNLLELWGCNVITAADKQEAVAHIRQQSRAPDAIIADYRLRKNLTGIEAIQAIHTEFNNEIPALIVTGEIAVDELREVNSSGYPVLHKPVAMAKLRSFIRNVQLQSNA